MTGKVIKICGRYIRNAIHRYSGWAVLSGKTRVQDPNANFRNAFAGSSTSSNDVCANLIPISSPDPIFIRQYAAAMFKILYSYSGWQNANYVLNEVKDPVRTIKIAGPLGLGITSALYIFANIAYFAYVSISS